MSDEQDLEASEQRQKEMLGGQAQLGAFYRVMCQSPAFLDLKRELDSRIADLKNKWLHASDEECAKIRVRAQIYDEIFTLIKSKILTGDNAARTLDKLTAPKHPYEN